MDGNIVKLVFQSIAQGSGFAKVSADTAALRKNLGMAGQAAHLLGQTMGDLGHMAGGAFSAVLRGNFWELGAIALHKTISLVKEHNKLMRDARLAARGLSADYNSLEKMAEGYRKRVAEWRRAKEEADAAEAEAAEARKRAAEMENERERERLSFEQKYYDLELEIAKETSNRETAGKDELTVLKAKIELMRKAADLSVRTAKGNLEYAKERGSGYDQGIAEQELKLAEERRKSVESQVRNLVDSYSKKEDERLDAASRKHDEEEARKREKEESEKRRKAEKDAAAARKKEIDELRKHIESETRIRDGLERALAEAEQRVSETKDFVGRAANMDQMGGVRENRQNMIDEARFEGGAADLIGRGKIKQGKDGVWRANGRLSNLNQAILDRLNAETNRKNVAKEQDKVVKKLDELLKKMEQLMEL